MSRIGNKEIKIPAGVTATINGSKIDVSGKLGSLSRTIDAGIAARIEGESIIVTRANDLAEIKAKHGLTRTLINNMVVGVSTGFKKSLTINGVGFKAVKQGNKIVLNIGYSHPVEFKEEDGITFELPSPTEVVVKGIDKEKVGAMAAKIRWVKPVEPYHHYGVKYTGEYVRKKEGKTGKK